MFNLAYLGKGFTIDLLQVPDVMLEDFWKWAEEADEMQRAHLEQLRSQLPRK